MVGRQGRLNGIGCDECCDDRHRNDDGIQEIVDDAKTHAQGCDDKRELTDLTETESTLQSLLQAQTGNQTTRHITQRLEEQQHHGDDQNLPPVVDQDLRVDHHAHRHEKHSTKQILDGSRDFMDRFCLKCFCQNGTHDERAQS